MNVLAESFGWLGNAGFFFGSLFIMRYKRWGWILHACGNWMYIIYGVLQNSPSILFVSIILLTTDVFGWWKWRKKEEVSIK